MHSPIVLSGIMLPVWIVINLWLNDIVQADVMCPSGFEFLAYEGNSIDLPWSFHKAYVTFGRAGFYSLSIISANEGTNSFLCDETLGKVVNAFDEQDTMAMGNTGGFFKHTKPKLKSMEPQKSICCICALRKAEEARMLLFPPEYTTILSEQNAETRWTSSDLPEVPIGLNWIEYNPKSGNPLTYDILTLSNDGRDNCGQILADLKIKMDKRGTCQARGLGLQTGTFQVHQPKTKTKTYLSALAGTGCYPSLTLCNTKNRMGLTVFVLTYTNRAQITQFIKAAYSMTGIFDVTTLFDDLINTLETTSTGTGYTIQYMTMYKFWNLVHKPLPRDARTKANVEWRLAAFCASCPGTSVTITTSESKVVTQKNRVQHAFNVNAKAFLEGGVNAGLAEAKIRTELGLGWTGTFLNELNEALSAGTSATIRAQCNGFYLYHFDVRIGSKQTGFVSIPTRYFYCTDRPYPPICVPYIAGYKEEEAGTIVCHGYDTNQDFGIPGDEQNNHYKAPWRSLHSGRPKPVRIVEMAQGATWHDAPAWQPPPTQRRPRLIRKASSVKTGSVKTGSFSTAVATGPHVHALSKTSVAKPLKSVATHTITNGQDLEWDDQSIVWMNSIVKPDNAPQEVFFEHQSGATTCLTHAINNLFGRANGVQNDWLNDVALILANGMDETVKRTQKMSEKRAAELCTVAAAEAKLMDYSGGYWSIGVATKFLELAHCGLQSFDGKGKEDNPDNHFDQEKLNALKVNANFVGFLMNSSRRHWFAIKWFENVEGGKWYKLDSLQPTAEQLGNDEVVLRLLKDTYRGPKLKASKKQGGYVGIVTANE
eukprot:565915_1